ncbi:hypothetical protein PR003_g20057 [Phytophthora rubi]|uniref:Uncharacterized protein n=1 Tax=Phytophthora rubi TaxID=129364 RepID=A0A6A3IWY6_9STRA|nr:hypothetical protein PR002_g22001 [Phytophthora rubi]KAE9024033.1 hypothetical protein PR001_g12773 [Phytophthora rubi]KAE9311265.1 hypothetical protein PR003_g20057 [Phytophthora rubi]
MRYCTLNYDNTYPPLPPCPLKPQRGDGYSTPTSKLLPKENQTQNLTQEMPSPSPWPISATGKRKRMDMEDELTSFLAPTPTKRKGSSDFLRKGPARRSDSPDS